MYTAVSEQVYKCPSKEGSGYARPVSGQVPDRCNDQSILSTKYCQLYNNNITDLQHIFTIMLNNIKYNSVKTQLHNDIHIGKRGMQLHYALSKQHYIINPVCCDLNHYRADQSTKFGKVIPQHILSDFRRGAIT